MNVRKLGGAERVALEAALARGDGEPLRRALAAGDSNHRELLFSALAPSVTESMLERWTELGDGGLAALLRADREVQLAWRARGSGTASTVSEDGAQRFTAHLEVAYEWASTAIAARPGDVLPYLSLLVVARGLGAESDGAEFFETGLLTSPDCHGLWSMELIRLTPKWGGSKASLFAHAERAAGFADVVSPVLHLLLLEAAIEQYLCEHMMEGKPEAFLADPDLRRSCTLAHDRYLAHRPSAPTDLRLRNSAAAWFAMVGDVERLRHELAAIDGTIVPVAWVYAQSGWSLVKQLDPTIHAMIVQGVKELR